MSDNHDAASALILVVDDDRGVRFALNKVLKAAGYAVECRADGQAAWEFLLANECDLLVTDLELPGLDGYELVKRAKEQFEALPVLVITAHTSSEAIARVHEHGVRGFISKPFRDVETIREKVETALSAAKQRAEITQKLRQTARHLKGVGRGKP